MEKIKKRTKIEKMNREINEQLEKLGLDVQFIECVNIHGKSTSTFGYTSLDLEKLADFYRQNQESEALVITVNFLESIEKLGLNCWPRKPKVYIKYQEKKRKLKWYWISEQLEEEESEVDFREIVPKLEQYGFPEEVKKIKMLLRFAPNSAKPFISELTDRVATNVATEDPPFLDFFRQQITNTISEVRHKNQ